MNSLKRKAVLRGLLWGLWVSIHDLWYAHTMHIKVVNDRKLGRTANVLYDRIKNQEVDLMT